MAVKILHPLFKPYYPKQSPMAKPIEIPSQPTLDDERELLSVVDNEAEYVEVRGKRFKFRDLNNHARHQITRIMLSKRGSELAVGVKCLAAARLNGYFKIKLFYKFLWRWYYFVKQYKDSELTDAIALIKKKVAPEAYFVNTTLLIGIKDTVMMMNRAEVSAMLQEQATGKNGKSAKNAPGSQNH
jgi:hypothetical protein